MKITDQYAHHLTVEDVLRMDFEQVCRTANLSSARNSEGKYVHREIEIRWQCYLRGAREALNLQKQLGK